jgi:hypothetical protein
MHLYSFIPCCLIFSTTLEAFSNILISGFADSIWPNKGCCRNMYILWTSSYTNGINTRLSCNYLTNLCNYILLQSYNWRRRSLASAFWQELLSEFYTRRHKLPGDSTAVQWPGFSFCRKSETNWTGNPTRYPGTTDHRNVGTAGIVNERKIQS